MITTLTPAAEVWSELERMVHSLCHQFRRRYGGDHEELLSEALLHYWSGYVTFNPEKGGLTKRIGYVIWHGLLDTKREQAKEALLREPMPEDITLTVVDLDEEPLTTGMSPDAAYLVGLALSPPLDVRAEVRDLAKKRSRNSALQDALAQWLLGLGWTWKRIREAWDEVSFALSEGT
jgi:hypothetical protein